MHFALQDAEAVVAALIPGNKGEPTPGDGPPATGDPQQLFVFVSEHGAPIAKPTSTCNSSQELIQADEEETPDLQDTSAAFQQLTAHVQVGTKLAQKAARKQKQKTPPPPSNAKIMAIAEDIARV